jgi:uncharacterized membrane protein (GlpM family)
MSPWILGGKRCSCAFSGEFFRKRLNADLENKGDPETMQNFAKWALWGILPSILFFLVAFVCFKKHLPLPIVLIASFAVWLGAAIVHQWS